MTETTRLPQAPFAVHPSGAAKAERRLGPVSRQIIPIAVSAPDDLAASRAAQTSPWANPPPPIEVRSASLGRDDLIDLTRRFQEAKGRGSRQTPAAIEAVTEVRVEEVRARAPWLSELPQALAQILRPGLTQRKRYRQLCALALRIHAATAPSAACAGGCSACCHVQVGMSAWEARMIGAELGLVVKTVAFRADPSSEAGRHFGGACGFLRDGRCSIYEWRPLACVMHHNLGPDATMCSLDVEPEDSYVPELNLGVFWLAYATLSGDGGGDISEFFDEARRTYPAIP